MMRIFICLLLCLYLQTSSAIVLTGTKTCNANFGITLGLKIVKNASMDLVTITMHGPSNRWFGIGFGANQMSGTYALVSTGSSGSVSERKLGNHNSGSSLASSITTLSNTNNGDGFRTIVLTRKTAVSGNGYYTFPTVNSTFNIICARGDSAGATTLEFHGETNYQRNQQIQVRAIATDSPTKRPTNAPTNKPTNSPTKRPTTAPPTQTPTTPIPSKAPTPKPTAVPTLPTTVPTNVPTVTPTTQQPTVSPVSSLVYYGYVELSSEFEQKAYVTMSVLDNFVKVEMQAQDDNTWFGLGFDAQQMNGTYAIVVQVEDGPEERRLGDHEPGNSLESSLFGIYIQNEDGLKKVTMMMNFTNNTNFNWEEKFIDVFDEDLETWELPVIWSKGQSDVFDYHGDNHRGLATMVFSTEGFQEEAKRASKVSHILALLCGFILTIFVALN